MDFMFMKSLARGVKVTGATVHFVDAGTDTGPIIMQKAVKVKDGDTPSITACNGKGRVEDPSESNQSHCQWKDM